MTVFDGVNPGVEDTTTLTVSNAEPTVIITQPTAAQILPLADPVSVTATINDPGSNDAITCTIDWGDGDIEPGAMLSRDLLRQPHVRRHR